MAPHVTTTQVGIVGGGPAGLMLSHLLALQGIDSVVVDHRTRSEIENTVRAGILERDSVRLLVDSGVSDNVLTAGDEHTGIELAFGGSTHRIDFQELVGASVWLYPQTSVFGDLVTARDEAGADLRYGVADTSVDDLTGRPVIRFTESDGAAHEVHCQYLVGADGSRSMCRQQVPDSDRRQFFREYPFAWFGILCAAPKSSPELIYNHSERGFALISQRTESMQRMYFQCRPDTDPATWSEDRIWGELQRRVGANGHQLHEGPITDRAVLQFRSFVNEPMRYGNMLLAGDAAHTVPPTGAKGLNLALADVRVLAEALERALLKGESEALDEYTTVALRRVWRAQHFSYWMTTLLHRIPSGSSFDERRQLGELESIASSVAGASYLAEGYTGWPTSAA